MVVLPDTQCYSDTPENDGIFTAQTRWIKQNLERHNIKAVLHLGDIVNNASFAEEWDVARGAMGILDGDHGDAIVPYSLAVGNHDIGVLDAENRATLFNQPQYFGPGSPYVGQSSAGDFFRPARGSTPGTPFPRTVRTIWCCRWSLAPVAPWWRGPTRCSPRIPIIG